MFPKIFNFSLQNEVEYISFRKKSIQHNRDNSIYLSVAILCMYLMLHTIWYYLELSRNFPQEKYFSNNIRIAAIIAILNIIYNYFYEHSEFLRREFVSQGVIMIISISILFLSSINSYVISNDPKNNLTPILIGAITVSALFRFSIKESLFVYICGIIFFSSLFFIWQASEVSFALNFSAIVNIYILSFIVNRRIFHSAYKYFKQLRLTESVNFTLKNALQQKDEVLAIVAHDLRGPIHNIKYMSELISDDKTPAEEKASLVELINTSCQNAESIINDIITLSKIKNTSDPIEIILLNEIISKIHSDFSANNFNRRINLNIANNEMFARIYKEKLKRILNNLLSNAVKFTPIEKKIYLNLYSEESHHVIEVIDEGIGIAEIDQQQLFKKYSEASRTGLNGEESIGLGLYIVKELTEMMNGRISYMPNEHGGSKFTVKLPKA